MRGAPQVGFSATMRKIKSLTSFESLFLPTCFLTLEMKPQYRRKPALCQRTTVSGVTTMRDRFQADQQRRASTQNSLSSTRSFGLGCLRFSTVSCCRSARFSRSKLPGMHALPVAFLQKIIQGRVHVRDAVLLGGLFCLLAILVRDTHNSEPGFLI